MNYRMDFPPPALQHTPGYHWLKPVSTNLAKDPKPIVLYWVPIAQKYAFEDSGVGVFVNTEGYIWMCPQPYPTEREAVQMVEKRAEDYWLIEVEKYLCQKVGRQWSPSGISIQTLIDELAALGGK